jgi:hypothetical protein
MVKYLGKDLLKETCNNKLPDYGQAWPSGPAIVWSFNKEFTKKEWKNQVKIFNNNRIEPYVADYTSLFHVAYEWAFPEAAKYGLCRLKELHNNLDEPDELPSLTAMKQILTHIKTSIKKYGTPSEKKEFIDEIISMQKTLEKVKDSHPKWYTELMVVLKKIEITIIN